MSLSVSLYSFTSRTALLTALAFACATPAVAADAAAADSDAAAAATAASSDDGGLNDIIVTAEKRPENLQKTAISISVLGTEDLVNRHVQSLLDLGDGAIPSLRIAPFFSRQSALIINVRGIGVLSDSNQPARDQGVGVYIDGVYLGRAQGLGTAIYDVASIEVLKGPQGTLFGRNTEGGAVSIVTKRPSGEFHLNTTAGVGNFGSHKGEVHLDLPSFANFSVKLDGIVTKRDGFVKNPLAGASDYGAQDKRGFHGEVMWKPSSNFTADYAFDTSYDGSTSLYQQLLAAPTGSPATATQLAISPNKLAAIARIQADRADTAVVGSPEQPSVGRTHGHRLNLEWQATPNLMIKSITSYRAMTQSQFDNGSAAGTLSQPITTANPTGAFNLPSNVAGVAYPGFAFSRYSLAQFDQNQFSEELQAIGEVGRVKYAVGALYYEEKVTDNAQAYNTDAFTDAAGSAYTVLTLDPATRPIDRASHVKTTSMGVYGQGTWTPAFFDEAFHLTLGARFTHDKKVGALLIVNNALPVLPVNGKNVTGPIPLNGSWSRVDPLVNLAFDASDDVHLYGKWSTGYKSGGANSRSLSYAAFNPETVSMFEIGAKTEFWNHKARFNIAAYTGTYKDIQLDFSGLYEDVVCDPITKLCSRVATTRTTTDTVNAPGTGKLRGVEAELTLAPVTGLTLTASYAYNKVEIPNTINPFPQTGSGGKPLPFAVPIYPVYTPTHSASGAIDYEAPMHGFTLRLHLDGNYDSGYYGAYTDSLIDAVAGEVRYKQPKGDAGFVVNGRIALADIDMGGSGAKVTVSIWARNLLDEQHVFLRSGSPTAGTTGFFNDPRTIGAELNIKL
jgi:iron complex outermembrane receptor protein